jgi:hypothetical protein
LYIIQRWLLSAHINFALVCKKVEPVLIRFSTKYSPDKAGAVGSIPTILEIGCSSAVEHVKSESAIGYVQHHYNHPPQEMGPLAAGGVHT